MGATELIKDYPKEHQAPILIDQGTADGFLANQLLPKNLTSAADKAGYRPITLRMQPGYDHSYYFISTFMKDHIEHHATTTGTTTTAGSTTTGTTATTTTGTTTTAGSTTT